MKLKTTRKNAISNVLGWFLPALIFLVLTPVMVKRLGTDGFGVVAMIQIITGYMTVLNFGFSEAIIKQIAENMESDRDKAMRVMWVGFGLFATFGGIGALILFFSAESLGMRVLAIPDNLRTESVTAIQVGAAVFLLQMIAEFYRGCALGCHRFDIPNNSRIIRIAISGMLIFYVLEHGGGIDAVMVATLIGLVIGLLINVLWMWRVVPMYYPRGNYRRVFSELFHFSKHIFFVRIAGLVASKISQFFLGTLSSVANVALYEVPVRVAETGAVILNRILQVFYPGFSALDKKHDLERMREIFFSVLSIQLLITTPFLIMVILEGPTLIAYWISEDFGESATSIIILVALTYYFSSLTNLPVFTAMSFNLPGIISKYSLIRMAITLVLVYPFITKFELIGAAWVLFMASLQGLALIQETTRRLFAVNFYQTLARPLLVHSILALSLYASYETFYRDSNWYSPFGVLVIAIFHPVISILFGATNSTDNRRIMKLVLIWR